MTSGRLTGFNFFHCSQHLFYGVRLWNRPLQLDGQASLKWMGGKKRIFGTPNIVVFSKSYCVLPKKLVCNDFFSELWKNGTGRRFEFKKKKQKSFKNIKKSLLGHKQCLFPATIKDHQPGCGSSVTPVVRQAPVPTARLLLNYLPHTLLFMAEFLQQHKAEHSMLARAQNTVH